MPENPYKAATLGRTPNSFSTNARSSLLGLRIQSPSVNSSAAASLSDVSINQSDTCSIISATIEEVDKLEEEDQEFYIWAVAFWAERTHSG